MPSGRIVKISSNDFARLLHTGVGINTLLSYHYLAFPARPLPRPVPLPLPLPRPRVAAFFLGELRSVMSVISVSSSLPSAKKWLLTCASLFLAALRLGAERVDGGGVGGSEGAPEGVSLSDPDSMNVDLRFRVDAVRALAPRPRGRPRPRAEDVVVDLRRVDFG